MKAIILTEKVPVYKDQNLSVPLDVELVAGTLVDLGTKVIDGVEVDLSDGRHGYIKGDTRIADLLKVLHILKQDEVIVCKEPSAQSVVKTQYKKGWEFYILDDTRDKDGKAWIRVRDLSGNEGFVEEGVKTWPGEALYKYMVETFGRGMNKEWIVKQLVKKGFPEAPVVHYANNFQQAIKQYKETPEGRQAMASKYARHMLYGPLWTIGGLLFTAISYNSAASSSTGGRYFIASGAIVGGIIQFFIGFFGWLKHRGS